MSRAVPTPFGSTTVAVLVVYRMRHHPDALIRQLRAAVGDVVLVDNSVAGDPALRSAAAELQVGWLHTRNRGGLAGAYNQALAHLAMQRPQTEHVLFVDDDSDASALQAFLGDEAVQDHLRRAGTAAVAPIYRDRATGLRGKHLWLRRCRFGYWPREFGGLLRVAFLINSMSVWRVDALRRIGPFNESLAVDHVDTEYCLRARAAGLALYVDGSHEFLHAIGERTRYRFLGHDLQAGGHAPERRFGIGRNTAWLARRWGRREPAFALLALSRLCYEAVGIVMAEADKGAKLRALLRGIAVGATARRLR